ncbi:MAG: hypothetical protein ACK550_03700 [Synechococcaceae cyanobacterium]|jgi:hypothetical protein
MSDSSQQQLGNTLWAIANQLHGVIDADGCPDGGGSKPQPCCLAQPAGLHPAPGLSPSSFVDDRGDDFDRDIAALHDAVGGVVHEGSQHKLGVGRTDLARLDVAGPAAT